MKTIPTERTKTMLEMCEEEAKIPTIERTRLFKKGDIRFTPTGYETCHEQKLHTPTMRIMWLLADELAVTPGISKRKLANILNDYLEEVEKTNGGRFD